MPDTLTEEKEQHRLGTIGRWDPPDGDWAAEYDWTRYRGPDPWPVPGGWVFGDPEEGGWWKYYGELGVGHANDNSILDALKEDETVTDPYEELEAAQGPYAYLNVETANPDEVSIRNHENEEYEWAFKIGDTAVFTRVEPERSDLLAAVAEALMAAHEGDLDERRNSIAPTTGRAPETELKKKAIEQRREENSSLSEFDTKP